MGSNNLPGAHMDTGQMFLNMWVRMCVCVYVICIYSLRVHPCHNACVYACQDLKKNQPPRDMEAYPTNLLTNVHESSAPPASAPASDVAMLVQPSWLWACGPGEHKVQNPLC